MKQIIFAVVVIFFLINNVAAQQQKPRVYSDLKIVVYTRYPLDSLQVVINGEKKFVKKDIHKKKNIHKFSFDVPFKEGELSINFQTEILYQNFGYNIFNVFLSPQPTGYKKSEFHVPYQKTKKMIMVMDFCKLYK